MIILVKDDVIEFEGVVTDVLPNTVFKVQLSNGHTVTAHISGKMRMNRYNIATIGRVRMPVVIQTDPGGKKMQSDSGICGILPSDGMNILFNEHLN